MDSLFERLSQVCRYEDSLARHERQGRLVLTVHLDTGSMVPPDVVDLSFLIVVITACSC